MYCNVMFYRAVITHTVEFLLSCSTSDQQDFHEMSHGLLLWLENIDRRRNEVVPIDPIQDSDTLHEHHKTLTVQSCKLYVNISRLKIGS